MATIDPNIALGVKPIQVENPMNQYAAMSQIQNNQQAQQLNALKMRQAQQEFDTSNAIANAYKGAITPEGNVNYNALIPSLASSGAGSAIPGVLKTKKETEQAVAMLEKTQIEAKQKKLEVQREQFANLSFNPSDENVKAHLQDSVLKGELPQQQADQLWAKVSNLNPAQRSQYFTEMGMKAHELGTYKETARHNAKTENISAGNLAVNQQRLENETNVDLQSKLAEAKSVGTTIGKNKATAIAALPGAIANASEAIRLIDEMVGKPEIRDKKGKIIQNATEPHAGFNTYVGATLTPGLRFIEGTDTAAFELRQKQIEGKAFLEAFNTLRGGGSITEKEGEKGTAAIMRMNKASSPDEYKAAARELQDVLRNGIQIAKTKAGATPGIAPPSGFVPD